MKCYNQEYHRYPIQNYFDEISHTCELHLHIDQLFITLYGVSSSIDFSFKNNQKNLQKIAYVNKRLVQQSEKAAFKITIDGDYGKFESYAIINNIFKGVYCYFSIASCFDLAIIPRNAKMYEIEIAKTENADLEFMAFLEDVLNIGFKKIKIGMILQEERQQVRDYFSETELVFQTIARHNILNIYRP